MVRSTWKIPYVNKFIFRQFIYNEDFYDTISYIWKASGRIFSALIGKEFLLSRGNSMLNLEIKEGMFNTNLGEYVISKNMGLSIHERNKKKLKKKKGSKKKKGVLANPLGYRLDLNGNWQDFWSLKSLTYTEFLHSSLKIRKFITSFFEFEKFWKTGILLNNVKIINTQKFMKVYITWYAGKSYDKKKYHYMPWYKKHIIKLIFYFRIWQTRLYWLRYKFKNIERNIFHNIIKSKKNLIYYHLKKKSYKFDKVKNIFKMKYTKQGNLIVSNLFSNLGKSLKKKLNETLKILMSKEKTAYAKFYDILQTKEKDVLNLNLKQKNKKKFSINFLKQIFTQIASKRQKWIGLNNVLNNKGINVWKLFLNLLKDDNVKNQVLIFMKFQKSYKLDFLHSLNQIKVFLTFFLLDLNKDLLILKKTIKKTKINSWVYFIEQIIKKQVDPISKMHNKEKLKTIYFCYYLLCKLKNNRLKVDLLNSYIEKIDCFLSKVKEEFSGKLIVPSNFDFNISNVYALSETGVETKTTFKSIKKMFSKHFWKKNFVLKRLQQFKILKKKNDRNLNWSSFLAWFPRFFYEKLKWKFNRRKNWTFILKKMKTFYENYYYDFYSLYRKRFVNKKLFFKRYKTLKRLGNKQMYRFRKIYNKFYKFKRKTVLFNFYKKLRYSITLNKSLFEAIRSKIFRFIYNDFKLITGPSIIKELWIYGQFSNFRVSHLKNYKFEKNRKAYDYLQYDLKRLWKKYNDPNDYYSFASTKKFIVDLDNWLNPMRILRFTGNLFYHSRKESRKENFFNLIINKSLFDFKKLKKFLPRTLRSWSLKRQIFGPPIRRKFKRRNSFKNRKKRFLKDFKFFLRQRSLKKFGIVKRILSESQKAYRKLNSKRLFWTFPFLKMENEMYKRSNFYLDNIEYISLYKYIMRKNWKNLGMLKLIRKKNLKKLKRVGSIIFWLPWLILSIASIRYTRNLNYYKEPFKMSEINWVLWLNLINLFRFKKWKHIDKYYKLLVKTWQSFNFRRRVFNLKYKIYNQNNLTNWIDKLFWTKWLLKSRGYFKSLILKYINNKFVEKFVIQKTKISVVKKNQSWLNLNSFRLKKKLYNLNFSKNAVLQDFKLIEHKSLKKEFVDLVKKNWNFKRLKKFWYIKKKKFFSRSKNLLEKRNINFRKILKNRYWKKRIYYMTHENPFKNYAGFIGLHKDFGKYIDFSKSKLGGYINFIKKIINIKSVLKKRIKKSFVIRKAKKVFGFLKTKWDFMFKLYFSENLRRFDFKFKNPRDNYNWIYKGFFYGKLRKKYYYHKQNPRFFIPKNALRTMLIKKQSYLENYNSHKIIKDNWWTFKKIKTKLSRYLKRNIQNLNLKFPLKKKVLKELKDESLITFGEKHSLKQENQNEEKKLSKLKKIFVFVLKLKQLLLNPNVYHKIWNSLNNLDKTIYIQRQPLKRLIRTNLDKVRKCKVNIVYQTLIDNFRNIFENIAKRKLQIFVFSVDNNNINAELLARYIIIKILQKYTLGFLLNPMKKELIKLIRLNVLDGFRIRLSGRFNRRQRSKVITINHGLLPLTEKSKNIDYNERTIVLKFSIMSIKILLFRNSEWNQKKKLQIVSPILRTDILNTFVKNYPKYTKTALNIGSYKNTIKTNATSDNKVIYNLKKKIVSNDKGYNNFNNKKQIIFGRIFKNAYNLYEIPYKDKTFVDKTLRAYFFVKDSKKNSNKQRWKTFRTFLNNNLNYGKLLLENKLNRSY